MKGRIRLTERSFEELARSTEDMNGAQLKAVCVEAGMVSHVRIREWQS